MCRFLVAPVGVRRPSPSPAKARDARTHALVHLHLHLHFVSFRFFFLNPVLSAAHFSCRPRFSRTIDVYVARLRTEENAAVARGYAMALGVLPRKLAGESGGACRANQRPFSGSCTCVRAKVVFDDLLRLLFFSAYIYVVFFFMRSVRPPPSAPRSSTQHCSPVVPIPFSFAG